MKLKVAFTFPKWTILLQGAKLPQLQLVWYGNLEGNGMGE